MCILSFPSASNIRVVLRFITCRKIVVSSLIPLVILEPLATNPSSTCQTGTAPPSRIPIVIFVLHHIFTIALDSHSPKTKLFFAFSQFSMRGFTATNTRPQSIGGTAMNILNNESDTDSKCPARRFVTCFGKCFVVFGLGRLISLGR